ncbi:MAG: aspartate--tRNA ligase [Bacteroidales bacterium]|nr:aspartate--tRNA ligase [Bacteroidales bacterium]
MYRSHHCGELNAEHIGNIVTLSGWVQKIRNKGKMIWVDLRDRYGITQLIFEEGITPVDAFSMAKNTGREFVIQATGEVIEREAKNPNMATGDIEIKVSALKVLNEASLPPFTIEDQTDGGEEIRMKFRYLDLRRNPLKEKLVLRHKLAQEVRRYLDDQGFLEIETPYLIKSTPEGARDFIVPSRMNEGQFYALPQSPQTFKQLLMVSGYDRYFQIVKCFRDEDLRADRQPEFTQIDCEMAFVEQEDVLNNFEGMAKHLFHKIKNIVFDFEFPRMPYQEAMRLYGSDKPDIRFGMQFVELKAETDKKEFVVFNSAEYVGGICAEGCANYSRKELDELTKFVQRPQVGAKGLVYVKYNEDGSLKSSVDKFYNEADLKEWAEKMDAKPGDLLLILAGETNATRNALNVLRLEMGDRLGLRNPESFAPLWVVDFPLLEWDEDSRRFHAMHHPFTSPKKEDIHLLESEPGKVRANAYDMVINGVEIGGGSIRIHDSQLQKLMFKTLGFTDEQAQSQFGFLIDAFKYGAPPHGGIALGFDRLTAMFAGIDSIRDVIAFPKNNSGRDMMIDSPSAVDQTQLDELFLSSTVKK